MSRLSNDIELLLAVAREVSALGQVLTNQSVGVFIGAALPRAVRVAEIHRHLRATAQLLVHRHLPTLVVRHALAHGLSDAKKLAREGLHHVGCARGLELGQFDEDEPPAGALDQGAHRAGVGRALDEASPPMAGELPTLNLGRA